MGTGNLKGEIERFISWNLQRFLIKIIIKISILTSCPLAEIAVCSSVVVGRLW